MKAQHTSEHAAAPPRLGPILLAPGISTGNGLMLLYAATFTIGLMVFINLMQPYVMSEYLNIPEAEQGRLTGVLAFITELVAIAFAGLVGAWSDRLARRRIYAAGFVLLALAMVVYPLVGSVQQLMAARLLFAFAAVMLSTMYAAVLADYPLESSRGRLVAIAGICNGLGILLVSFLFVRLPEIFQARGSSPELAGKLAFWLVAVVALITAIFVRVGLHGGVSQRSRVGLLAQFRGGLGMAAQPRIAIAYASAFISRGDIAVVGLFVVLWLSQQGRAAGMSATEALARGGMMVGIIQGAALLASPFIGVLADRIDRVRMMALGMGLSAAGFLYFGLVRDPLAPTVYPAAMLMGIGQIAAVISAQTLIGQEAPKETRGAILGVFTLFGALGILCMTMIGGFLFDFWRPGAPFILLGALALVLAVVSVVRSGMERRLAPGAEAPAAPPASES